MEKSDDYDVLVPWLGRGLLLSSGAKWHARRKAITTAFHFKILENFMEDFIHHCAVLVDKIQVMDLDNEINVYPVMQRLGLNIICGKIVVSLCIST
jgi:cytochrome P450 family 4